MAQDTKWIERLRPTAAGLGILEAEEATDSPPDRAWDDPDQDETCEQESWAARGAADLRADGRRRRDDEEGEFEDEEIHDDEEEFEDDEGLEEDFDSEFDDDEDLDDDLDEDLDEEEEL